MNTATNLKLALIPLAQINGALVGIGLSPRVGKDEAVTAVADCIANGSLTLADVQKAKPYVTPQTTGGADRALNLASDAVASVKEVTDRLRALEAQTSGNVAGLKAAIDGVYSDVADDIKAAIAGVKPVDPAAISNAVATAVAAEFGKFRKATPKKRIEEIAAVLPAATVRAGDVFPRTWYHSGDTDVDFSDLPVTIWNQDCPQVVDDYVFDPAHLHQSLIALHDTGGLPDNVWLAGERGTGKTEFVTQLAARLKRRLVRVNFDEAIERADFIGGNTIKDGSVVWKEGVITAAIQQAGTIILIDEVGFARAQSIAILHSLTERSPHRALVVAETGQRIPVANDVVFFCADNSNGHGDTSGNFAGVREQNSAFIDRFSYTLRFQYLEAADEVNLVCNRTGLTRKAADILVKFINVARQKASNGLLTQPPSLRQLFALARAVQRGVPPSIAFQNAVVNKFPSDVAPELLGVWTAEVNASDLAAALKQ